MTIPQIKIHLLLAPSLYDSNIGSKTPVVKNFEKHISIKNKQITVKCNKLGTSHHMK